MIKAKFVILKSEHESDFMWWVDACKRREAQVQFTVIDLTKRNWLHEIKKIKPDYLLAKPGGINAKFKEAYDERIRILVNDLNYPIFPSEKEIYIYENKRYLAYWLEANEISHPKTYVFYYKKEATEFIRRAKLPIVAKLNIGASGKGIEIIRNLSQAEKYINDIFLKGKASKSGPNLSKGKLLQRIINKTREPGGLKERIRTYNKISHSKQLGFVIFQEYIPHNFEWRVVRIGQSFFAHKKLREGRLASGSLLKEYGNIPLELLDYVKDITDTHNFFSQAVDIFEYPNGNYSVNEMQCIFGQSDNYQMLINGIPGRYRYVNDKWIFEEGDFAKNACYDLRIEFVLNELMRLRK